MPAIRCPNCGTLQPAPETGGETPFRCPACGKAVEPAVGVRPEVVPPPIAGGGGRWSDGPPEESASRWAMQSPLGGDDSSSSESLSPDSVLPRTEPVEQQEPDSPRPSRWNTLLLYGGIVLFILALVAVVFLGRSLRPALEARRAARQSDLKHLLVRLAGGPNEARREAARAIVDQGPKAVADALDQIATSDGDRYQFISGTTRAFAEVGEPAAESLAAALNHPKPNVRIAAVYVLREMGAPGRAARPALLAAIDDETAWVRGYAIDALGNLGADGAPATKQLADLVGSLDLATRRRAIEALGRIGPDAADAKKALGIAARDDPDMGIRRSAEAALRQIQLTELAQAARREATGRVKQWLKDLDGNDASSAATAAKSLGALGNEAFPALPCLALAVRRSDASVQVAAIEAMADLGLPALDYLPAVEAAAKAGDPAVRAAAAKALETLGIKPR